MGWTSPRTWVAGEVETAAIFNAHVRDNLNYLLTRPGQRIIRNNTAAYTTTSTSFVDVDATNLAITLVMSGTAVIVSFSGVVVNGGAGGSVAFDFTINGTRYNASSTWGIWYNGLVAATNLPAGFCVLATGLTPGSNVFKLQWFGNANTTSLQSATGNSLPTFCVQEVS